MGLYLGGDEVSQNISLVSTGLKLPEQEGQAGKFLTTDGENPSWGEIDLSQIDEKQDVLVSGTNIKTINGENILGEGDIEIKTNGSGRNIGDIFYTLRTNPELNGAVECNGGFYNIGDFGGRDSIGELLNGDILPYVSLEEFENSWINNGSCRAFGWDGGERFRVPLLKDVYISAGDATTAGEFISESLPNITGELVEYMHGQRSAESNGAFETTFTATSVASNGSGISYDSTTFDASRVSSTYKNGAKVRPDTIRYRAMVQLANSTTDEAVITATSALQQISDIVPTITYWE